MKKILIAILAICMAFSFVSCGEDEVVCEKHVDADANSLCDVCGEAYVCPGHADADANNTCDVCGAPYTAEPEAPTPDTLDGSIEITLSCYKNSVPTKVVTQVQRTVGKNAYTLDALYTLTTGTCAGKVATKYEAVYDELRTVEDGSDNIVKDVFVEVTEVKEYLLGRGVRENGGTWKSTGLNFAPTAGSIGLNITKDNITDVTFTAAKYNNSISFIVPVDNIEDVFGLNADGDVNIDATSDVAVTILNNGAQITGVVIAYSIKASNNVPAQTVVIATEYSYGIQVVDIVE